MKHKYDLFEKYRDGSSLWRDSVSGFESTCLRLKELALRSANQYYAIDLTTGEVLAFLSKRAMLADSTYFQELKDEARAVLLKYGTYGCRIFGEDEGLACSPKWVN